MRCAFMQALVEQSRNFDAIALDVAEVQEVAVG
jgi:hypothetical protein